MYTLKGSPYSSHSILLRALPADGSGQKVLDVGCGSGYLGALLAERGFEVTGIEREGCYITPFPPSVKLIEADLENGLPELPAAYFDYILCADILEHLRHPAGLLTQLRPVLRPGGSLVASLPNSGNIYFRLNVLAGRFPQDDKGLFDRTHVRFFMWAGWEDLLQRSGWQVRSMEPTGIPVGLAAPATWEHSPVVHAAERVCYGLAKIRKTLFAYQFVVIACPKNTK